VTAFSDLYEKYSADVFRFSLFLSGNRADAEDITSETFVRAFAASDRIAAVTAKAYLFEIARNLFLMSIRNRSRHAALNDELRDSKPSAYDRVAQKAELATVMASLQMLPEVDRAALLLRTLGERSYDEIAQALKISVVSARVKPKPELGFSDAYTTSFVEAPRQIHQQHIRAEERCEYPYIFRRESKPTLLSRSPRRSWPPSV
jgi:RNA polymerase sigma-70 factor (ECF subfamily)